MYRIIYCLILLAIAMPTPAPGKEGPLPPKDEFTFAVLGDSQFHRPGAFNRVVDEVALLNPAFVIQVGDLISGYVETEDEFRAQWKRFKGQISGLGDIPYYPVSGNHDIMDKDREPGGVDVYRKIWGDLYYSFDYRNSHFTILATDIGDYRREIGRDQLKWLESDLKRARRKSHRFVFFHRPIHSLKNGDELHELFVKHKVTAVFYGHQHHYHHYVRDGITYVMTMAATRLGTPFDEAGSFHHYLLATVRDTAFSYVAVRKGGIVPPGMVAPEDNKGLYGINRRLLRTRSVSYDSLKTVEDGKSVSIALRNPTDQELHVYLEWDLPTLRWEIGPERGRLVTLPAQTPEHLTEFVVRYTGKGSPEAYPVCEIQTLYLTHDGDWITTEKTFTIRAAEEKR